MNLNDFGSRAQTLQTEGIELAKADHPDFIGARDMLIQAEIAAAMCADPLSALVFSGRTHNDLGVVNIREGLYARSHDGASDQKALEQVTTGINQIEVSYRALRSILYHYNAELRDRNWRPSVHGHLTGTMNTWFRATQTAQLLTGAIGLHTYADREVVEAQWMLGRGTKGEPGAWVHGRQGDNGYWSTQTSFLGLRGERINGGPLHVAKAIKWAIVRGFPEVGRQVRNDPANRKQIVQTVGRLISESITRKGAIAAALDYRKF